MLTNKALASSYSPGEVTFLLSDLSDQPLERDLLAEAIQRESRLVREEATKRPDDAPGLTTACGEGPPPRKRKAGAA